MKLPCLPALFLFAAASAFALEQWADGKLPVKDGVELWLDAARQPVVREARGLPEPGGTLDVWFDGSGHGRHMAQRVASSQPRWQRSAGGAFVRFDGKDDWLGPGNLGASLEAATVFIVAAPRTNAGFYRGLFAGSEISRNDYQTGLNLDLGGKATPTFTAVLLGEERGELRFADATGAVRTIARAALKSLDALPTSLMPPGLLDALTPAERRDLLTFLLIPAMEPAPIQAPNPPPPPTRSFSASCCARGRRITGRVSTTILFGRNAGRGCSGWPKAWR